MRLVLPLLLVAGLEVPPAAAQGVITTLAGTDWLFPGDGLPAEDAPLEGTSGMGVAVDNAGSYFIADADNHMVMRVGPDGVLTVIAGNGIAAHSGDNGPAIAAALGSPVALALDAAGDLYVASALNRIRKISRGGVITPVAGSGVVGRFTGDGGPATLASLNSPQDVAVDSAGVVYVADTFNHRIRKITPDGVITTVAGIGQGGFRGDGGPAVEALLHEPHGVAVDGAGNIYIADTRNGRVRRISPQGIITTVAGGGFSLGDGVATEAAIVPRSVRVDAAGALYISDIRTDRVRRVVDRIITTVAGSGERGFSGDGGPALNARLNTPLSAAVDLAGNVYIGDSGNHRIRRVNPNGVIDTVAGNGLFRFSGEGEAATAALLYLPTGAAFGPTGSIYYFSEPSRNRVRWISGGVLRTFAGTGQEGFSGDGGLATQATMSSPTALAFDAGSNALLISDQANHRIRRVGSNGVISTIAGTGVPGFSDDGVSAVVAALNAPEGIAVGPDGILTATYVADTGNHRIRKIDAYGIITTVAGTGMQGFSGDVGPAVQARLSSPRGIVVDGSGHVYFSDTGNHRIRRIDRNHATISTIAGTGQAAYSGDGGPAIQASLNRPAGLAFDAAGNLCVADEGNHRIRRISLGANPIITTVAGTGVPGLSGDGLQAVQARVSGPFALAVDPSRNDVTFTDRLNHRLRQIKGTRPGLQIAPVQLNFSGNSAAAPPPSQRVHLISGTPNVLFFSTVLTESGGNWLSVSPASGTVPATVEVSVNPANLTFGTYHGTVTLLSPESNPPALSVAVEFHVEPRLPGELAARPETMSFALIVGASVSTQTLDVANLGSGEVDFTVATATTSGGAWLSASPQRSTATASAGASVEVRADPSGLGTGTYTGRVILANLETEEQTVVPVVMSVNPVPQRMLVSPAGLAFAAVQNGGAVPPQRFQILNAGAGEMNWNAEVTQLAGGVPWLSVGPDSGSVVGAFTGSPVEVRINPAGLAPGDYYGQIDISSPQAVNSPQTVTVALKLLPAGTDPGPVVQPIGLIFRGRQGVSPGSQNILVSNLSSSPFSFRSARAVVGERNWFVHIPSDGTVTPERSRRIVVQPDTVDLDPGVYEGSLTLVFSEGTSRTVQLLLVNAPAPPSGFTGSFAEHPCEPSRLLPMFQSVGLETTVLAAWPNRLVAEVVDDCGDPLTEGLVVAEFSNGDPPLTLSSEQDGKWSGIWQVRSAGASQVTIRLKASLPGQGIEGTSEFTASLIPGGDEPPEVSPGGVVSAASFVPIPPVAPGGFISIFGARLSDHVETSQVVPFPTELAGTSAFIAGRRLPLYYTSEGQINAIVPYDVPMNTTHQLLVRRGNRIAPPESVTVASAQPGILARDMRGVHGEGQGIVLIHPELGYADASNPARAGDIVIIYCLGLGPVSPLVAEGTAAPGDPLSTVNGEVSLTIGGVEAEVSFAGLAPGWVGLYQVNAIVPHGVAPGDAVPVVLTVSGQESPPMKMAIQ